MKSTTIHFAMILTLLSFIACVPQSKNPLTSPGEQKIDNQIFGTWSWKEKNERGYIHIGLDTKGKQLRILMVDIDNNNELEISELKGHTSKLGKNTYLNLKMVKPDDEMKDYLIVKYMVTPKNLGISVIEDDLIEKAIEKKALKGKIKKSTWVPEIEVTDSSKNLREFVVKNDKKLFEEMKYLPRL